MVLHSHTLYFLPHLPLFSLLIYRPYLCLSISFSAKKPQHHHLRISESTPKKTGQSKVRECPFLTRFKVCLVRIRPCRRLVRVGHQYDTGASTRGFSPCRCFLAHEPFSRTRLPANKNKLLELKRG
ncbi:hypothetical protein ES332_D10G050000v1 [Gossypium tomentosum]|uniref:Uncharacterized protein n=1 Tax=Gossypium tomentosum TaxID=34277 RepID=A0A5D2J1A8_GOSTO|nr:hypothetical protein ES332_D10G050000v1 [Gossypium tomentosum]